MAGFFLMQFLAPARFRRLQMAAQVAAIRARDGDHCTRCRRELRFDRPAGHDDAPRVEAIEIPGTFVSQRSAGSQPLTNLCLTHGRCNVPGRDHTSEARERLRPAREAELFGKSRGRKAA